MGLIVGLGLRKDGGTKKEHRMLPSGARQRVRWVDVRLLQYWIRSAGADRCTASDRGCTGSADVEVDHSIFRRAEVAHTGLVERSRGRTHAVGQNQSTARADHADLHGSSSRSSRCRQ